VATGTAAIRRHGGGGRHPTILAGLPTGAPCPAVHLGRVGRSVRSVGGRSHSLPTG